MRLRAITTMLLCALCGLRSALAEPYTVQTGDTAFSIASSFGIKVDELLRRNGLTSTALRLGQVLDVPGRSKLAAPIRKHVVAAGETLYAIARKYGSSVEAIRTANGLGDVPLRVGQVIVVPRVPTTSAASSSPVYPVPATSSPKPPTPSAPQPKPTVTVKPSPPPLANLGMPPNANPSPAPNPSIPATVTGVNVKPLTAAPLPPRPLPRGTVTLPPPAHNNPFSPARDSPPADGLLRTASSAPLPDLGSPPNEPNDPVTATATEPPDSPPSATPNDPTSGEAGTVGAEPEILHSVARGETLSSIARRYGVEVNAIKQANNLVVDAISVGQILKIPVIPGVNVPADPGVGVRDVSERYLGVTYRFGGASTDGLDCSGFVVIVFSELGIRVPRTSAQQFVFGQPVERADLRAGDLVFFNTSGQGVSHVGIYLEAGEFIHAASNPGRVIKSTLEEKYYAQRYLGARRVMTDD